MDISKLWLQVTIGGYPFVTSAFFIALALLGISDIAFVERIFGVTPFIAVTFSAYVIGLSIHLIIQFIAQLLCKEYAYQPKRDIWLFNQDSPGLHKLMGDAYSVHVMLRLLAAGMIALIVSISFWAISVRPQANWVIPVIICAFLFVLFSTAYFIHRRTMQKLTNEIYKK